jgi:hypothetical protein
LKTTYKAKRIRKKLIITLKKISKNIHRILFEGRIDEAYLEKIKQEHLERLARAGYCQHHL